MKARIDNLIAALLLVRLGQSLGTDSQPARVVHGIVELLLSALR